MLKSDLKETIAKNFLSDSSDFLQRFKILYEVSLSSHIGMRSKLLIDLVFSAECSLKALIFLESNDTEQKTYEKIFKHDLKILINKLSENEKENCKKYIDEKLYNYNVNNRYMIEAYKKYRPNGILDKEYYDTIANCHWVNSIYSNLNNLNKYVWDKIKIKIEEFSFDEIDVNEMEKEHNIIMNLKKKNKEKRTNGT